MISTHAFAEDALARACVPALSIYPSGSRKTHYFRNDTVVEATVVLYVVRIFIRANIGINIWQEDVCR